MACGVRAWIFLSAVLGSVHAGCTSDEDCSLLGVCTSGSCVCDPGWRGSDCAVADLAPYQVGDGYINQSFASWGGRAIQSGGKWHLFPTQIARQCPLILFMNNSEVVHAVADNISGPYKFQEVALPPFHHNPTTIGPTPDGYYLIYSIGQVWPGPEYLIPCENGIPACASTQLRCKSVAQPDPNGEISMAWSKSLDGPWSSRVILPKYNASAGAWNCANNNPSAVVHPSGKVTLMYHGRDCDNILKGERLGLADTDHWNASYIRRPGEPIISPANGTGSHEDPFMFIDKRGNYHAVTHNQETGNLCSPSSESCAAHLFSRDSYSWTVSKSAVYDANITFSNGTKATLQTRQRPQIVFSDEDPSRPIALFNGASLTGDNKDLSSLTHTLMFHFN